MSLRDLVALSTQSTPIRPLILKKRVVCRTGLQSGASSRVTQRQAGVQLQTHMNKIVHVSAVGCVHVVGALGLSRARMVRVVVLEEDPCPLFACSTALSEVHPSVLLVSGLKQVWPKAGMAQASLPRSAHRRVGTRPLPHGPWETPAPLRPVVEDPAPSSRHPAPGHFAP